MAVRVYGEEVEGGVGSGSGTTQATSDRRNGVDK